MDKTPDGWEVHPLPGWCDINRTPFDQPKTYQETAGRERERGPPCERTRSKNETSRRREYKTPLSSGRPRTPCLTFI